MSKKVGLVHVHSAAVTAQKCPPAGVEQFVNDHFQTGDFTGYTQLNMVIDKGTCKNAWGDGIGPYIGSYDAAQGNGGASVSLQQVLPSPVKGACVSAAAIFSITTADLESSCAASTQNARILYTDGTYTDVTLNPAGAQGWVTYNLLPYVQAGKIIRGLLFTGTSKTYLFPCDIHVGQVSFKMPSVGSAVVWDDGLSGEGASAWSTSYNETLSDDPSDKPDGKHSSLDITIGSEGAFDDVINNLSVLAAYYYIDFWWKGNNTGQLIDFIIYTSGSGDAYVQWTDNFTGWKHLRFSKDVFTILSPVNWSNVTGIEIANDQASGLTRGLVFKIAIVTNDYP